MKNTFALVNKTPPEILSLVPTYLEDSHDDKTLIKLTHVCRSWRAVFISRPSLWARLDCKNTDRTRVYIERSKTFPLKICLEQADDTFYREEAFLLAVPHIPRLKSLSVSGNPDQVLPVLVEHLSRPVPLLNYLKINFECVEAPALPDELFNGDLSTLREFSLAGVITPLPWRGLLNLTTFNLSRIPEDKILLTQLLDFFESAPNLRHIHLHDSIPNSSNAPTERVVSLSQLKDLNVTTQPEHFILLNHLSIPAGASLRLEFAFSGEEFSVPSCLPGSLDSLPNLSHITAVGLCFGWERLSMRLNGPSGELYMVGKWTHRTARFMRFLDQFDTSRTRWLAIALYTYDPNDLAQIVTWGAYKTLRHMDGLRTLMLSQCNNLPFIHTLNPDKNPSKIVLCPELEEIILYNNHPDEFRIEELLSMAKERASRGAKLLAITIVSIGAFAPMKEVFRLRKHVLRVEYKFEDAPPKWDTLPC